jgi:hypothetical protein
MRCLCVDARKSPLAPLFQRGVEGTGIKGDFRGERNLVLLIPKGKNVLPNHPEDDVQIVLTIESSNPRRLPE